MPDTLQRSEPDLSGIPDADVRRALRLMHQHYAEQFRNQQLEIDALFEMMLEHQIGSIGEIKRHLLRLQQNSTRGQRIHEALAAAQAASLGRSAVPH